MIRHTYIEKQLLHSAAGFMERRLVELTIPIEFILQCVRRGIFNSKEKLKKFYLSPGFPGIPKDAFLVDIKFDYENCTMSFVLEHPSFDKVEPGLYMPSKTIRLEKDC